MDIYLQHLQMKYKVFPFPVLQELHKSRALSLDCIDANKDAIRLPDSTDRLQTFEIFYRQKRYFLQVYRLAVKN